jgi:hypothetical protein
MLSLPGPVCGHALQHDTVPFKQKCFVFTCPHTGTTRVLNRTTKALVNCTQAFCPYSEPYIPARVGPNVGGCMLWPCHFIPQGCAPWTPSISARQHLPCIANLRTGETTMLGCCWLLYSRVRFDVCNTSSESLCMVPLILLVCPGYHELHPAWVMGQSCTLPSIWRVDRGHLIHCHP